MPPKSGVGGASSKPTRPSWLDRLQLHQEDEASMDPGLLSMLQSRRAFYASTDYAAARDLAMACLQPGPPQQFLLYYLHLQSNAKNRLTLKEFKEWAALEGAGCHWWKNFTGAMFSCYRTESRPGSESSQANEMV